MLLNIVFYAIYGGFTAVLLYLYSITVKVDSIRFNS